MSTTMNPAGHRHLGPAARAPAYGVRGKSPARSSSASCAASRSPRGSATGEVYGAPLAERRPVLEVDPPAGVLRAAGAEPDDRHRRVLHGPRVERRRGTDLADALAPFAERLTDLIKPVFYKMRHTVLPRGLNPANTKDGARKNIEAHYDLSNEMFPQFLDPTMSYSSALFDALDTPPALADLEAAQLHKVDAILDAAGVTSGLPGARDRHRLGHAGDPGRRARRDRDHGDPVGRAGRARPAARRRRRRRPTGSRSRCATTATRTASSTPWSASR